MIVPGRNQVTPFLGCVPILVAASVLTLAACAPRESPPVTKPDTTGSTGPEPAGILNHSPVEGFTSAEEIAAARERYDRFLHRFRERLRQRWGDREAVVPTRHRFVKYGNGYLSRAVVDFESGNIRVESLDTRSPVASLRNAVVATLLTPDDPRAVDLYSDRNITASRNPYLLGLVLDQAGQPINDPSQAKRFADWLIKRGKRSRIVDTPHGRRAAVYVDLRMVPDHLAHQARRYASAVDRSSKRFRVSKSLVYAVMKVESDFNPFAVSSAPAYGLMQLVPDTGGRDAYRHAKGRDVIPSRDYLFVPGNNIELGTAYLNLIESKYLAGIRNPVSREYCTIAAYNGGIGDVLRIFSADRDQAIRTINGLKPRQLLNTLIRRHPRLETRRYVKKVLKARRSFRQL